MRPNWEVCFLSSSHNCRPECLTLFCASSGKSTLLLTLLRLPDIHHGTIRVDGVDLSLVPRTLVRQRCFITISQDVLLLGQASLRFNLDVRLGDIMPQTIC